MPLKQLRTITCDILRTTEQILRAAEPPIDRQQLAELRKKVALAHTVFFAEQIAYPAFARLISSAKRSPC